MAYNIANAGSPSASRVNLTPLSSNRKEPKVKVPSGSTDAIDRVKEEDNDNK